MPVFLSWQLNSKTKPHSRNSERYKERKGDSFSANVGWRGVVRGFDRDLMLEAIVYFPALCYIQWVRYLIRLIGFIFAL